MLFVQDHLKPYNKPTVTTGKDNEVQNTVVQYLLRNLIPRIEVRCCSLKQLRLPKSRHKTNREFSACYYVDTNKYI